MDLGVGISPDYVNYAVAGMRTLERLITRLLLAKLRHLRSETPPEPMIDVLNSAKLARLLYYNKSEEQYTPVLDRKAEIVPLMYGWTSRKERLTDEKRQEIFLLKSNGVLQKDIALMVDLSEGTVSNVLKSVC